MVQSLASASCLGGAADMLADIQQHGSAVTRLVAGLAAAVASVLPGALASADERLQAAASVLGAADDDGRAEAILRAEPETAGRA